MVAASHRIPSATKPGQKDPPTDWLSFIFMPSRYCAVNSPNSVNSSLQPRPLTRCRAACSDDIAKRCPQVALYRVVALLNGD